MRTRIFDFELDNPLYAGAQVYFYTVSGGVKTAMHADVFEAISGPAEAANPQVLNGFGRFDQPVYVEEDVVLTISGPFINQHDTGIISFATAAQLNVSAFSETVLDDTSAGSWLSTLGFSTFFKTLIGAANLAALLNLFGISAFIQTLLDDTDAASARSTLGIAGGLVAIAGNATLTNSALGKTHVISASADVNLPASATMSNGDIIYFKSETTGYVRVQRQGSDTIDGLTEYQLPSFCDCAVMKTGVNTYILWRKPDANVGDVKIGSYSTAELGWLAADGSNVSRTTYAGLHAKYTAASYPFGAGDGSSTMGLPSTAGRAVIGTGTGTLVASGVSGDVDVSTDAFTVTSNVDTWITGMDVVFVLASGTITGLSSSSTYYVVRASATTIKLASSLANALAGTVIDLTAKSSPVWSLTHTLSARSLGTKAGQQQHAQTDTEVGTHVHTAPANNGGIAGSSNWTMQGTTSANVTVPVNANSGGNAFNVMSPALALTMFVKT